MQITFHGAAGEVTGSCHLVQANDQQLLLECGLIQGRRQDELRNRQPFGFDPSRLGAVVLSHAHLDHSGRLPLLVSQGYRGPIYCHPATRDLCEIMLRDAAYLAEKDAEWENRKRERKGLKLVEPLYTTEDAERALRQFETLEYDARREILPGISLRLRDAGHILGSALVEVWLVEGGAQRKLVFSGDLGQPHTPVLRDPMSIKQADLVLLESTYGNRMHRPWEDTRREIGEVLAAARDDGGNVLIPAFAVDRTQELLYLFATHFDEWGLGAHQIFLDSPLAIAATEVYLKHADLFDRKAAAAFKRHQAESLLPNLHFSRTSQDSMALNKIRSGAIIVAASGMCTGGRIVHHLKHNAWRRETHIIIVGFQAKGTTGRMLVDGAEHIRLWGETIRVGAQVHTIGGLSAHADQQALCDWYGRFEQGPPVALVHGEAEARDVLAERLRVEFTAKVWTPQPGDRLDLLRGRPIG
jgi:metallo-beta-lactamase family protein